MPWWARTLVTCIFDMKPQDYYNITDDEILSGYKMQNIMFSLPTMFCLYFFLLAYKFNYSVHTVGYVNVIRTSDCNVIRTPDFNVIRTGCFNVIRIGCFNVIRTPDFNVGRTGSFNVGRIALEGQHNIG